MILQAFWQCCNVLVLMFLRPSRCAMGLPSKAAVVNRYPVSYYTCSLQRGPQHSDCTDNIALASGRYVLIVQLCECCRGWYNLEAH